MHGRRRIIAPILLVVVLVGLSFDRAVRPLLVLGTVVLLGYVVGYVWWHLGDHGGLVPHGHTHASPVTLVVEHVAADLAAFATIVNELGGADAFVGRLAGGDGRSAE